MDPLTDDETPWGSPRHVEVAPPGPRPGFIYNYACDSDIRRAFKELTDGDNQPRLDSFGPIPFLSEHASLLNVAYVTYVLASVIVSALEGSNIVLSGNVPHLNCPAKFRRSSKRHVHDSDSSTTVNNGLSRAWRRRRPNLESGSQYAWCRSCSDRREPCAMVASLQLPKTSGNPGSDDSRTRWASRRWLASGCGPNVRGPHALAGMMPNGLDTARLAQPNGMNLFEVNMYAGHSQPGRDGHHP
ncbi:hypothetical protein EDB85DRAFT_1900050 [Lactarius pseudohatsudake]|nr:hypothetical protein EDB85DRAFT_1900050 [Lactarius pseudohatsudake]